MTVKLSLEFEATPSNDAGLKALLDGIAKLAMTPSSPAQAAPIEVEEPVDPMPDPDPEPDPMPDPEPEPAPEPKKTRTRTKKTQEPPAEKAAPVNETPDPNLNPIEAEARQGQDPLPSYQQLPPKEKPKYTIDWVRRLLAEKVGKYRAECKQKLAEFGASNVSTLDPDKYSDFVDYLNTLNV